MLSHKLLNLALSGDLALIDLAEASKQEALDDADCRMSLGGRCAECQPISLAAGFESLDHQRRKQSTVHDEPPVLCVAIFLYVILMYDRAVGPVK